MKKKKIIVCACVCLCLALVAVVLIIVFKSKEEPGMDPITLEQVKKAFSSDIQALQDGEYENLTYSDFTASIEAVEGLYHLEIQSDQSYETNTFLENFAIMNEVIDNFFQEEIDKSFLVADFQLSDEETVYVDYNDIEQECTDEKYNMPRSEFLFGNETSNGGYMVQIDEALAHTWFSRYELGDIHPSEYKKVYPYITCIRQNDDVEINLKDGSIKLSELEESVLDYLNHDFPLSHEESISFGIGDVRIVDYKEYEGACFKVRRIYKGVPFEYGSNLAEGMYIDELDTDGGEISYAASTYPDTMLAFGRVNGKVVETESISEIFSLGSALHLLSEEIGANSVYEVRGVELVYRNCEIPEEQDDELDDILVPKWKIITINQNDDKYTLFYVDVVTGEITERFEYYYE